MQAFTAKGRLSLLLAQIPMQVVLNDRAARVGAAEIASEREYSPWLAVA